MFLWGSSLLSCQTSLCLPRSFLCLKGFVLNLFLHVLSTGNSLCHLLTFSYTSVTPKLALTFLWSPKLHQPGRTACFDTSDSAPLKCSLSPPSRPPPWHPGSGKLSVSISCSFSPDASDSISSSLYLCSLSSTLGLPSPPLFPG